MAGQWQGGQWQPEENVQPNVQRNVQFPQFPGPPGQQYPGQPYQGPYPPRQRRKSRKGWAAIGCLGFAGLVVVIAAVAASHPSSSVPAALPTLPTVAVSQQAAPASSAAAKAVAKTVATFSGSGAGNTPPFTTGATWKLSYSFDCSGFGYKGNFQVYDYGSDGIPHGVMANDLAMSKSGSSWSYNDPGTHHLNVNSECSWTVKITDES
jgi:hypothetical protein